MFQLCFSSGKNESVRSSSRSRETWKICSVSVGASIVEKETRVLAHALTLTLFQYPEPGSNRHSIAATGV